ncbi:3-oxoacyl-ACP reductase FabG [Methylocystis rosea]|uniref:3-oxoacyl-ACP reductase FabG n=1 Tax=Methylocystis rosea TaxID=173366 RepID=UPI00036EDDA5|nr:3-oxoacyl-ACP reductase FabG [Methylocystis rosea]
MLTSIADRSVIVTGGSRGIGRGVARVFAAKGAQVLVVGRDLAQAEATAAAIRAEGGRASGFAADVGNPGDVERMAAAALERHGGIDILCANAGVFPAARMMDMTLEQWNEVFSTNLAGAFLSVRACVPALARSGRGRIVLTSSITGPITGYPGWTHYAASKAGQLGFMRTAALELTPYGITINAVLPGNVRTEGLDALGEDYLAQMTASIPQRRLGSVEDIAYAALFFASDEAGYITGQTLVIDGGQVLPESLTAIEEMVR